MKKIFFLFAALISAMTMSAVTYNVTVPAGTKACYIAGEMTGWSHTEMTKVDDTHYTLELAEATDAMKYKYCSGPGWAYVEKTADGGEVADRTYSAADVVENWASVYEPSATPEEPGETKDITVKAKVPAEWTDQITAWVWPTGGAGTEVVPTQEGDWYVVTENCTELNIIYKNGYGWNGDAYQTVDMTFTENTCIEITAGSGKATYTAVDCPESGETPVDPTPDPETGVTYNVTVPAGTYACYIAGEMNAWTQQEMTKVDETHYTITIAEATTAMGYKYCSGPAWDYVECGAEGEELANRVYSENDVVVAWRAVYNPEGGDTPVDPTPGEVTYVLMGVAGDWTTGIALEANPENENEYMLLGQEIAEGDSVKVVTITNGTQTAWCNNVDENSPVEYELAGEYNNIVLVPGIYDFYYKVAEDLIYIGAAGPVDPTPDPEYVEDVITNMMFDLENMVIIGGPSENFQIDVYLPLGEDNFDGSFKLSPESSVAIMGIDATFIDGIAYEIDPYAPAALVDLVVEWNGALFQLHLTMSAAPMEATVVVVENANLEVEEYEVFDGMYEYAAKLTGNWINEADGLTYPVLVEVPVYYPEATEPYEIMTTVTVGGWGDTDPWLGFGEGYLTVSIVDGVVTATGIVENPMAGVAIDITITTGTLTPDVPETGLTYNVTVPEGTKACYIAGMMNDWAQQEMTKVDDTHYTITIAHATADMEYKYCSGPDWAYVEKGAEGEELANRTYSENDVVATWAAVYDPNGGEDPTPGEVTYALMGVAGDWDTGIALTRNESALEEEYVLLNQPIAEGDAVKVVTLTDGVATAWCGNVDEASAVSYTIDPEWGNIILAAGTYDFYYKVATDNIYIAVSTATGVDTIDVEKKAVKVIRDGQMFIIRDNVVYSVLGQVVK